MPLYDLKCPGCGDKVKNWYKGMNDDYPSCAKCSQVTERDFSTGTARLDGVSQGGWPRADMSVDPVILRDGSGKVTGWRPQVFNSRRHADKWYAKNGFVRR